MEEESIAKFLIGLDFSINKPAMTIRLPYDNEYAFYIFPLAISDKLENLYKKADVNVYNRKWFSIKKKDYTSSELANLHIKRAVELANIIYKTIINTINTYIGSDGSCILYICSEGLSFASKGDASLDLATYKGILLSTFYRHFCLENTDHKINLGGVLTYAPITIKSLAGCANKESIANKNAMIEAFMNQNTNTKFQKMLIEGKFKAKKNYKTCVDDIVDSYWAVQTMIKKENLDG